MPASGENSAKTRELPAARGPSSAGWFRVFGWPLYCTIAALLLVPIAVYGIDQVWPYRYRNVEPTLEKVFASKIKIAHYHRTYFPNPGFVADGVTLRRNSAASLPPVGSIKEVKVQGRWLDLLMLRDRIRFVYADGLHVAIPPVGSKANKEDFPPGSSSDFTGPTTLVEVLDIRNSQLDILCNGGGRYSYPIQHLVIRNLQANQTITYTVEMQDAAPPGHIQSQGSFGPLLGDKLGATPVSGRFSFTAVNLSSIHGIAGTLAASGSFRGTLANIEATAQSAVPDFAVEGARPTPVSGTVSGAVNTLNGDILLRAIDLQMGKTDAHVAGSIAGAPKVTELELTVAKGRVQDLLQPFLKSEAPIVGAVRLQSHGRISAASAGKTFLERLTMSGSFEIPAGHITNSATEQSLSALSRRAQGLHAAKGENFPAAGVVSTVTGAVVLRDGVAHTPRLSFEVPGAVVDVSGDYNLLSERIHMTGHLQMHSDISHVTTGLKSFLLKPLAPFFRGKHAGTVVPIKITGAPGSYKVEQNIFP